MIVIPVGLPTLPDRGAIQIGSPVTGAQAASIALRQISLWGYRARRAAHTEAEWGMASSRPALYQTPSKIGTEMEVVWRCHTRPAYVALIVRAAVGTDPAEILPLLYSAPMPAVGAAAVWTLRDTGSPWTTVGGDLVADLATVGPFDVAYRPVTVWTGETPVLPGVGLPRPLDASAIGGDALLKVRLEPQDCRLIGVDAYELHPQQVTP